MSLSRFSGSDAGDMVDMSGRDTASFLAMICKWCGRSSQDPNPLTYQAHMKPTLPWRRAKGCECNLCPYALDLDPELRKPEVRKELLRKLEHGTQAEKTEARSQVLGVLKTWQAEKIRTGGAHVMCAQPSVDAQVEVVKTAALETRQLHGGPPRCILRSRRKNLPRSSCRRWTTKGKT
jgi:hypothetical protein